MILQSARNSLAGLCRKSMIVVKKSVRSASTPSFQTGRPDLIERDARVPVPVSSLSSSAASARKIDIHERGSALSDTRHRDCDQPADWPRVLVAPFRLGSVRRARRPTISTEVVTTYTYDALWPSGLFASPMLLPRMNRAPERSDANPSRENSSRFPNPLTRLSKTSRRKRIPFATRPAQVRVDS